MRAGEFIAEITKQAAIAQYKGIQDYKPGKDRPAKPKPTDQEEFIRITVNRAKKPPSVKEEQLDELSFLGSECTKDCSGHRAGYEWSSRKGNARAASWSPSFNKGAALRATGK